MHLIDLIALLSQPGAYPHATGAIDVRQTHISAVFLAGPFAYKIKKPIDLGFLDFTSIEKRRFYCDEEVRLNRRSAPNVYLGVVPITRNGVEAGGEVVEWAVKMQRLPSDATLETHVERGTITREQIATLAERVARFHQSAESNERISRFGRFDVVAANARDNFMQTEAHIGATVSAEVHRRLRERTEAVLGELHELIEARAARNVPRDTHGDLHLDHVYHFPEQTPPSDMVLIDCIEFADRFRFADPVADMAFLVMDLKYHGRRDLAQLFADVYFVVSGDAEGRVLLPFYSAYRAMVRAKVEGLKFAEREVDAAERQTAETQARAHWLLALGELESPEKRPRIVLIGGLPGTGKSTLAKRLAEADGFEVLRSDVVRKQSAKTEAATIYTDSWDERTYAELARLAEQRLWLGGRVIIDANFRKQWQRDLFVALARRWAVPFAFIECVTAPEVVRQRLAARRGDVSDADWAVYQQLALIWEPVRERHIVVDTEVENWVEIASRFIAEQV